jgi:hypothetical protein
MRVRVLIASAAAVIAFAPADAPARPTVDTGIANAGYGFYNYWSSGAFTRLLRQMGARYVRFGFSWDVAGTWDPAHKRCVTPTSFDGSEYWDNHPISEHYELYHWLSALRTINSDEGTHYVPLIVLGGGKTNDAYPRTADAHKLPTDLDMTCAVYELDATLYGWFGNAWPGIPIEPFNEPDFSPGYEPISVSADRAARYFADAWVGNAAFRAGDAAHVIAGVFSNAEPGTLDINNPKRDCSSLEGANDPVSAAYASSPYAEAYMCYLTGSGNDPDTKPIAATGGKALSSFARYANSWSFHDYQDIDDSVRNGCSPAHASGCVNPDLANFYRWLASWNGTDGLAEPENDIWITESGNPNRWGIASTPTQDAQAAYAFWHLADATRQSTVSGLACNCSLHLLWYEFTTPNLDGSSGQPARALRRKPVSKFDSFDSALIDSSVSDLNQHGHGLEDPSYCVLFEGPQWYDECADSPR